MLNPDFNTITVFLTENKKSLYILFLSDSLELMVLEANDNLISRTETMEMGKRYGKNKLQNLTKSTAAGSSTA